jgi:hypothetical protein
LKQERVLGNGINRNNNGKFQLDKKSYMNWRPHSRSKLWSMGLYFLLHQK